MTGWSEQDKKAYAKFGRRPQKSVHAARVLNGREKQHFDSADYEMQKEQPGKVPGAAVSFL